MKFKPCTVPNGWHCLMLAFHKFPPFELERPHLCSVVGGQRCIFLQPWLTKESHRVRLWHKGSQAKHIRTFCSPNTALISMVMFSALQWWLWHTSAHGQKAALGNELLWLWPWASLTLVQLWVLYPQHWQLPSAQLCSSWSHRPPSLVPQDITGVPLYRGVLWAHRDPHWEVALGSRAQVSSGLK